MRFALTKSSRCRQRSRCFQPEVGVRLGLASGVRGARSEEASIRAPELECVGSVTRLAPLCSSN
jgi:hypothetical protein